MEKYKIIALIGEAGSGKDFLMKMLLELHDYHEIISCTSRPMREGEKNGRNYYFYSDEYFMQLVEENKMMEWTSFNNWYYGTPISALSKKKINIGVFSPAGIRSMLARDDIDLRVFYVSVSPTAKNIQMWRRLFVATAPMLKILRIEISLAQQWEMRIFRRQCLRPTISSGSRTTPIN